MVVTVSSDPSFAASRPEKLFSGSYALDQPEVGIANYDVAPDGERFVMVAPPGATNDAPSLPTLVVVLNWFQELTERVPTN